MYAGVAKADITPSRPLWMDGMIRAHASEGIHDSIYVRALYVGEAKNNGFVIISADIVCLTNEDNADIRRRVAEAAGTSASRVVIACSHTHSGPAVFGIFGNKEPAYLASILTSFEDVARKAADSARPVVCECRQGWEDTISHYRRLMAKDGHVVMNWEPYPAEQIVGPLGVADSEVGILRFTDVDTLEKTLAILFNHAGHPNVMSGENYLISGDYPGLAERLLEETHECVALFVNGAQGTMDIDGLKDRDWDGVDRTGGALANSVNVALGAKSDCVCEPIRGDITRYKVPLRNVTDDDYKWALDVIERTGGVLQPQADGVGEDFIATLLKELYEKPDKQIEVEQTCIAFGDCAYITFPGELYTEIGMSIKQKSPFKYTYIIGLANGYIGYIPTMKAIEEGGYAEDTRRVDAPADRIIEEESIKLLQKLYAQR